METRRREIDSARDKPQSATNWLSRLRPVQRIVPPRCPAQVVGLPGRARRAYFPTPAGLPLAAAALGEFPSGHDPAPSGQGFDFRMFLIGCGTRGIPRLPSRARQFHQEGRVIRPARWGPFGEPLAPEGLDPDHGSDLIAVHVDILPARTVPANATTVSSMRL